MGPSHDEGFNRGLCKRNYYDILQSLPSWHLNILVVKFIVLCAHSMIQALHDDFEVEYLDLATLLHLGLWCGLGAFFITICCLSARRDTGLYRETNQSRVNIRDSLWVHIWVLWRAKIDGWWVGDDTRNDFIVRRWLRLPGFMSRNRLLSISNRNSSNISADLSHEVWGRGRAHWLYRAICDSGIAQWLKQYSG